jgi:dihydrofolate reductase
MRRLRYQVAASLDGFIADINGGFDWIVTDPDIDFRELSARFDTAIMGRKTFVASLAHGNGTVPGLEVVVFSRTLSPVDYPAVSIVNADAVDAVRALKSSEGRDIWLFGGGELFRTLLEANLVDSVEAAVMPVLLGGGIPMLPPTSARPQLSLRSHRLYPRSGIVLLEYAITNST